MKNLKSALFVAASILASGGVAHAGFAYGPLSFTVWSGTYNDLGISGQADLADAPAVALPSAEFNYSGPIDFSTTSASNTAGDFLGPNAASDITSYVSPTGQFLTTNDFLTGDTLSTPGESGTALVTYMKITGTYTATAGTTITVSHDDGASLYYGPFFAPLFLSPNFTVNIPNTVTLTGAEAGTNVPFMLVYVEANGAPSVLQLTTVPEPGSLALLGTGLVGLGLVLNRRRKRRT